MRLLSSILVAAIFAGATIALWAYLNRPATLPPWPKRIQGFAFSPYRIHQDGSLERQPTVQELEQDLALLAGKTVAVRTYSVLGTLGEVPRLAWQQQPHIKVALGAWLGEDKVRNEKEIAKAVHIAQNAPNIIRLFVGNESLLRKELNVSELTAYLDRVREAVDKPVSTAEP